VPPARPRTLAEEHALWARRIARRLARSHAVTYYLEDLEAAALLAVHETVRTFDPTKGDFKTYAWKPIAGAVLNAIRKEGRHALRSAVVESAARRDRPDGEADPIEQLFHFAAEIMEDAYLQSLGAEARANGEASLLKREEYERLHAAILRLEAHDRRLVELRYFDGHPWKQVAEELGIPERTAKDHDHRLREQLLGFLKER
jgi:RNA polymerase sigma factor (sigma-70 family)